MAWEPYPAIGYGVSWHGLRIQRWSPGAALWTNPCVQVTGGASRPLLSRLGGLWAWESGCGRGPSQPTPRAPRPGRACPSGPAESRNRRLIRGAAACTTPLCLPVAGGNLAGTPTSACWCRPRTSPPSHAHTHVCLDNLLPLLGRSSDSPPSAAAALSLILPCCVQRSDPCPGAVWGCAIGSSPNRHLMLIRCIQDAGLST